MRLTSILLLLTCLAGCGSGAKLKPSPVAVSGKVSQGGQPVGGIVLILQPLANGHLKEFPTKKDGTFKGEMISGDYAYYVAKPAVANRTQQRNVRPKYFEADLSRRVTVEPDKLLAINLD